ncbi:MAG: PA2778 family cysteine peptidase [Woeseia sp.]
MNTRTPTRTTRFTKKTGFAPVFFVTVVLGGCSTIPPAVSNYGALTSPLELADTPFFPQDAYQCGPAALMTILTASDVSTSLDELVRQVYLPAREGSLQGEMLAATRGAERVPYILKPALSDITAELAAGRPVLILQNLSISWAPLWHYAVVVGVDPEKDELVLRSGTDARRIMRKTVFLRTWRRSDYWAFVALRPGELPANPDRQRYADAVAGLEQTGHVASAKLAWQAGVAHWPNDTVQLFGLANTEYALGNFHSAERIYRQLLDVDGSLPGAQNNLAMTLLALDQPLAALRQIDAALAVANGSVWHEALLDTRRSILKAIDNKPE